MSDTSSESPSDARRQTRILVVDDEEAIVELVGEYLRARGFDVVTASDGDSALAAVVRDRPDVVLADLRLPRRGGVSLLEAIREQPRAVAVVVMTGFGTVETATQAMKLGASDYLLKPVRLRDLHAAVVRALEELRRRQDLVRRQALCALYEGLLGIGPPPAPDDLARALAVAVRDRVDARRVEVLLSEDGQWRTLAAVGEDPTDGEPAEVIEQVGEGAGLQVALTGVDPGIDVGQWVRDVTRRTARVLGGLAATG